MRLSTNVRISPSLSPFFQEGLRDAPLGPRGGLAEDDSRHWSGRAAHETGALKPGEPVIRVVGALDALESGYGLVPVQDEHGVSCPDLLEVGTQAVLDF
jgi:hypothetical protein